MLIHKLGCIDSRGGNIQWKYEGIVTWQSPALSGSSLYTRVNETLWPEKLNSRAYKSDHFSAIAQVVTLFRHT